MDRERVVEKLKQLEPALRARGIDALYLYGSHARDEARADSDLDILVDFAADTPARIDDVLGAAELVEDRFPGMPVGLTTRDRLHDLYRPHVEGSVLRVF
jgi:uncharacterized protein